MRSPRCPLDRSSLGRFLRAPLGPPRVLRELVRTRGDDPERVRIFAIGERWHMPLRAHEHSE